jgi:RNA recognition motif-containing protein
MGYAFVNLTDASDVQRAVDEAHDYKVDGRTLQI